MKIASKTPPIKTRKTRRITVHGHSYEFEPTQDAGGNTHYVAEVKDENHVDTLIKSGHFYRFSKEMQGKPTLTPPTKGGEGGEGGGSDGGGGGDIRPPVTGIPEEVMAQASKLLSGNAADIARDVGSTDIAVAQAALVIEKASDKSRANVVKVLEQTIEGARAAGVLKD